MLYFAFSQHIGCLLSFLECNCKSIRGVGLWLSNCIQIVHCCLCCIQFDRYNGVPQNMLAFVCFFEGKMQKHVTHARACTRVLTHARTQAHTFLHALWRAHTQTYTHTHTHAHTNTHAQMLAGRQAIAIRQIADFSANNEGGFKCVWSAYR